MTPTPLSPAVLDLCRTHWPQQCRGCPLAAPCGTRTPTTPEGIAAYAERINTAAEAVGRAVA